MSELSIITHIYNAQEGVAHQVALWKTLNPSLLQRLEFIVIDDHSDQPIQVDRGPLNLRQFRVDSDIDWNMPGCRNLGAIQACSPWLLYFDVDNVAPGDQLEKLVLGLQGLDPTRLCVFRRVHDGREVEPHINSFLISRKGFFRAGGYDEDFAGHYGYEDVLFRNLWRKHVGGETLIQDVVFQQMGWRTNDLNRDTTRNQALIQYKAALGMPRPQNLLRFAWHEVD
jgi:hypothetical protein